jgi:hypothetical protein
LRGRARGLVLLVVLFFHSPAHAVVAPFGLAVFPPVQLPFSGGSILGSRFSLITGRHFGVYGVDLGLIGNITTEHFVGTAVSGIYNWTKGSATVLGLQFAGIANINTDYTRVYGVQASFGFNTNLGDTKIYGLQIGLLGNSAPQTKVYGVQIGLLNEAQAIYGFQIGLVNMTQQLHGVQIGLANFSTRYVSSGAPFLNIGF